MGSYSSRLARKKICGIISNQSQFDIAYHLITSTLNECNQIQRVIMQPRIVIGPGQPKMQISKFHVTQYRKNKKNHAVVVIPKKSYSIAGIHNIQFGSLLSIYAVRAVNKQQIKRQTILKNVTVKGKQDACYQIKKNFALRALFPQQAQKKIQYLLNHRKQTELIQIKQDIQPSRHQEKIFSSFDQSEFLSDEPSKLSNNNQKKFQLFKQRMIGSQKIQKWNSIITGGLSAYQKQRQSDQKDLDKIFARMILH